jgi:hypothetical protein
MHGRDSYNVQVFISTIHTWHMLNLRVEKFNILVYLVNIHF